MAYLLFVSSGSGVTIEPTYQYKEVDDKIEQVIRTRSGRRYNYLWGSFKKWSLPVEFVTSSFKAIVNSYWASNANLLFKSESSSAVYSVQLTNNTLPIGQLIKPYEDMFKGVIEVETY